MPLSIKVARNIPIEKTDQHQMKDKSGLIIDRVYPVSNRDIKKRNRRTNQRKFNLPENCRYRFHSHRLYRQTHGTLPSILQVRAP